MNRIMLAGMVLASFLVLSAVIEQARAEETAAERHGDKAHNALGSALSYLGTFTKTTFMGRGEACADEIEAMTDECLDGYQLRVEAEQDRIADEWGRRAGVE